MTTHRRESLAALAGAVGAPLPQHAPTETLNPEDLLHHTQTLELVASEITAHRHALAALESIQGRLVSFAGTPLSPRAAQAFHNAYANAIAGLERYHETLPALECFDGSNAGLALTVSTESIGQAVRRAIDLVLAGLKRMGELMAKALERIAPHVRAMTFEVARQQQLVKGVFGQTPSAQEIALGMRASSVSTELAPVRQAADLIRNLDELTRQLDVITGTHQPNMEKLARNYQQALAHPPTDADGVAQWKHTLDQDMLKYGPTQLMSSFHAMKRVSDPRFSAVGTMAAAPLPGQRSLVFNIPQSGTPGLGQTAQARVELTRLNQGGIKDFSAATMRAMSPAEIQEVLRLCERLLQEVAKATIYGQRNRTVELSKTTARAAQSLEANYNGPQGALAEVISAGATIATWMTLPYVPLITLASSVVGAALSVTRRHLLTYNVVQLP